MTKLAAECRSLSAEFVFGVRNVAVWAQNSAFCIRPNLKCRSLGAEFKFRLIPCTLAVGSPLSAFEMSQFERRIPNSQLALYLTGPTFEQSVFGSPLWQMSQFGCRISLFHIPQWHHYTSPRAILH